VAKEIIMPTNAIAKMNRPKRIDDMPPDAIAHLMDMKEMQQYFYGAKKERDWRQTQLRLMALLCTINTIDKVASIFGVGKDVVKRAWRIYRHELRDASITRNVILQGMCERKAIETLQGLNVEKVSDDKKGRLVKDLMDSAALATEKIAPRENEKNENVMELIFRIKQHAKPVPVKTDEDEDDGDTIEGEVVEQPQIPEKTMP
jgi:hypothetical protein